MVLPGVVGFKLSGKLRNGVTATDLVLTVTQMLRKHGVVGKFVEFYGKWMNHYSLLFFYSLFIIKIVFVLISNDFNITQCFCIHLTYVH